MKKNIEQVVTAVISDYIKYTYKELLELPENGVIFEKKFNAQLFTIELAIEKYTNDKLRVRVQANSNKWWGIFCGYAEYFGKTSNDEVFYEEDDKDIIF